MRASVEKSRDGPGKMNSDPEKVEFEVDISYESASGHNELSFFFHFAVSPHLVIYRHSITLF